VRWAALSLVVATAALAQDENLPPAFLDFRMLSSQGQPFPWYLDARQANPAGIGLASVQAAEEGAWSAWNAVSCALPKAKFMGKSSDLPIPTPNDRYDAFSVMPLWVMSHTDPDWVNVISDTSVVGLTIPLAYGGVLEQCDTFINAADHAYTTATPTPTDVFDLQTVVTHEAGHCLGLDHFGTPNSVMFRTVSPAQQRRALTAEDSAGLCQRYPVMGGLGSPCAANGTGCNAGFKCASQVFDAGTVRYCTVGCTVGAGTGTCEVPYTCQSSTLFSGTNTGACLRTETTVTEIGKPCSASSQCGSSVGMCQPQIANGQGQPIWSGGYCFQTCAPGQPACPYGSQCTDIGDTQPVCLKTCRVGLADCRPDYACAATNAAGVCIPICRQDADCGDTTNFFCRSCDGLCVNRQSGTGALGDPCNTFSQCGAGQICTGLDGRKGNLCSLGCGKGCATCPGGAVCHPAGPQGSLVCLKACTGPGTCGAGLQCANLPTGKGCVPACTADGECAVGLRCQFGECLPPNAFDGGCGPFCERVDGGMPIPPRDGGMTTTPGGGGQGCGCGAGAFGPALGLALLGLTRRRRSPLARG